MSKLSVGLIEVRGLALAIEVCDSVLKSANVTLIGYEYAKGSGMTTIKVSGDVGAVKASIEAGKSVALNYNGLVSAHVIPRPTDDTEKLVYSNNNNIASDVKNNDKEKVKEIEPEKAEPEKIEEVIIVTESATIEPIFDNTQNIEPPKKAKKSR